MTNEERELPPGWTWTTIGEITEPVERTDPTENPDVEFNYLDIASIDNTTYKITEPKTYLGKDAPSRARQVVLSGDILFSTVRTYLKNIAQVPPQYDKQIASTGFAVLRANTALTENYLFHYCLTAEFLTPLSKIQRGTSYPAVRDSDVREQPIPLAPLPEQRRIVAKIEALLTNLDAGVAALKRTQAKLKRYKASVLKAACEGRLVPQDTNDEPADQLLARILAERRTKWEADLIAKGKDPKKAKYEEPQAPDTNELPELPKGWVWATVEQIGAVSEQAVLTGPFGSNLGREDFIDVGVPLLTIGCLTDQGLNLDKAVYVSESKANELDRYRVKSGDLLFSRMASVGRADIVPSRLAGSLINYHLMRLRLAATVIDASFFISYVRGSQSVVDYIKDVNHGATRDGINTEQLLNMPVILPPIAEQRRIVAEVERRLSVVQELDQTLNANLARAEWLRQAILKRAFAGQLVSQDPGDEPAEKLLKRIKAVMADSPAPSTTQAHAKHGRAAQPALFKEE